MAVKTVPPKLREQYEFDRMRARSGWMYTVRARSEGVLMEHYAAIMDDFGTLIRIDSRTTPPLVLRPGDGS